MDKNIGRLKVIFEHLKADLSVKDFHSRLSLQKTVYFIQLAGIDLGYRFSWYRHGPYSRELTEAAYKYHHYKEFFDSKSAGFVVTDSGKEKLNKVRQLTRPENGIDSPDWLELLASIHYLKHIAFVPEANRITGENARQKLKDLGKVHFSEEQVQAAWLALGNAGLIDHRKWPH